MKPEPYRTPPDIFDISVLSAIRFVQGLNTLSQVAFSVVQLSAFLMVMIFFLYP